MSTALMDVGLDFDLWLGRVDRVVARTLGVSVHDLDDIDFRPWFDAGDPPDRAAHDIVEDVLYEYGMGDAEPMYVTI